MSPNPLEEDVKSRTTVFWQLLKANPKPLALPTASQFSTRLTSGPSSPLRSIPDVALFKIRTERRVMPVIPGAEWMP